MGFYKGEQSMVFSLVTSVLVARPTQIQTLSRIPQDTQIKRKISVFNSGQMSEKLV